MAGWAAPFNGGYSVIALDGREERPDRHNALTTRLCGGASLWRDKLTRGIVTSVTYCRAREE